MGKRIQGGRFQGFLPPRQCCCRAGMLCKSPCTMQAISFSHKPCCCSPRLGAGSGGAV